MVSFGDRGIALRPGEGKPFNNPGHPTTIKAEKEHTGGAYSLLEVIILGHGPTQHIHKAEEEAFYILEGEVNIKVGEQTVRGVAGSFVLIPRGTVHTYWNAGLTPAKLLILFSPAGFEQMGFEIAGAGEIGTATYTERVRSIGQKYNMEVVGPPLG
jgi:quercetin dioxygenase-like cupin family protein